MANKNGSEAIAETRRRLADVPDLSMNKYPNTEEGARQCLLDMGNELIVTHFGPDSGATWKIDPSFDGVWQGTAKIGARAIVYMAGYPEGITDRIRSHNDFETDLESFPDEDLYGSVNR